MMSCVGRMEMTPSFANLYQPEEKRILLMLENVTMIILLPFVVYAKVRSSISEMGIGIFCEIDKESGNYVYEFRNGRLYDKTDKTQYKNLHFLLFYFLNYSHDPLNVILYQLESDSNWKQYIGAYR